MSLTLLVLQIEIPLQKSVLGSVKDVALLIISLMNRLNKAASAIFLFKFWFDCCRWIDQNKKQHFFPRETLYWW